MGIDSKRRSDIASTPWKKLEYSRDLTDCLRNPWPEDYEPVEKRNEWNGFVCGKDKMPKRVLIRDSFMRRMPDGHWVDQRADWEALELLVFEQSSLNAGCQGPATKASLSIECKPNLITLISDFENILNNFAQTHTASSIV